VYHGGGGGAREGRLLRRGRSACRRLCAALAERGLGTVGTPDTAYQGAMTMGRMSMGWSGPWASDGPFRLASVGPRGVGGGDGGGDGGPCDGVGEGDEGGDGGREGNWRASPSVISPVSPRRSRQRTTYEIASSSEAGHAHGHGHGMVVALGTEWSRRWAWAGHGDGHGMLARLLDQIEPEEVGRLVHQDAHAPRQLAVGSDRQPNRRIMGG